MPGLPASTVRDDFVTIGGGLNLMVPALSMPPGMVIDSNNYEPDVLGGYRRIAGYERVDGRPAPSDQTYWILSATITGAIAVGNTITGATSAATAKVLAVSGTDVVISKLTGTFVVAEALNVGGLPQATVTAAASQTSANTPKLDAQYTNLAADLYRADILAVPGSGAIRGVWVYNDIRYAFRDNVGATACVMYKATAGGWVAVTLGYEVSFTAGSVSPTEGASITQGANSATVRRVVLETGTFAAGTAAGRIILAAAPAPGNFVAGALTGGGTATLSGAATAITLIPGGRFEFDNINFTGALATYRMYGCDGKNREFEFDSAGDVFVPLNTGMTLRATFVRGFKNQLFYGFGPSLQHSGIGNPYTWTVITGAAELALGDIITGMEVQAGFENGGALAVWTRKKTFMLYGSSSADWNLVTFAPQSGAEPYSAQNLGVDAIYHENRGIATLGTTRNYGNFQNATISQLIQRFIDSKRGKGTASSIVRGRNEYRIYFVNSTDNTNLIVAMQGKKLLGFMLFDYGRPVRCACSQELSDGSEVVLFGSDDGYVYQAEKGTSFDGADIEAWLIFPYNHSKSPRTYKQYRSSQFEFSAEGYGELSISYDLGYADPDIPVSDTNSGEIISGGGRWDSMTWDQFFWDARPIQPLQIDMKGLAENVSFVVYSKGDYFSPHVLQSNLITYTPRRNKR